MKGVAFFVVAVLMCAALLAPMSSYAYDGRDDVKTNKTSYVIDSYNKFHFGGYSNQTLSFGGYSNMTLSFGGFSNQTNIGQIISEYMHERNALEKQERTEILAAEKACGLQAKTINKNDDTKQQCIENIKSIQHKFQSELSQLEQQFKQALESATHQNHKIQTPEKNKQVLYGVINKISQEHHDSPPMPKHIEDHKDQKNRHR